MEKTFITSDINITAFLIHKGFRVLKTELQGRRTEFIFPPEAEEQANNWQFAATGEMKLIQGFLMEKDKLLNFLKSRGNQNYEKY